MNVVVAGATGFVGSHLLPELQRQGHTVRGGELRQIIQHGVGVAGAKRQDIQRLAGPCRGRDHQNHQASDGDKRSSKRGHV